MSDTSELARRVGGRGELDNRSQYHPITWLRERGREEDSVPFPCLHIIGQTQQPVHRSGLATRNTLTQNRVGWPWTEYFYFLVKALIITVITTVIIFRKAPDLPYFNVFYLIFLHTMPVSVVRCTIDPCIGTTLLLQLSYSWRLSWTEYQIKKRLRFRV